MLLCMGVVPFFLSRPVGLLFLGIEKIKKREREREGPYERACHVPIQLL